MGIAPTISAVPEGTDVVTDTATAHDVVDEEEDCEDGSSLL